jgi:hypothetical protein
MDSITWKPIETAPKDGSQILLKYNNNSIASGSYRFGNIWTEPQPCVVDFRTDLGGEYALRPAEWTEIENITGTAGYKKGEA